MHEEEQRQNFLISINCYDLCTNEAILIYSDYILNTLVKIRYLFKF